LFIGHIAILRGLRAQSPFLPDTGMIYGLLSVSKRSRNPVKNPRRDRTALQSDSKIDL
jgi:hypothetical protein